VAFRGSNHTLAHIHMAKLEEVFGVSTKLVLSYLPRNRIDKKFKTAIASDRLIVVYGSSKQGKSSLLAHHSELVKKQLVIHLTPNFTTEAIYVEMLRQYGVKFLTEITFKKGNKSTAKVSNEVKATIPTAVEAKTAIEAANEASYETQHRYQEITVDLSLANNVAELVTKLGNGRFVVLENFHYLNEETQKDLAFDLRTFQERGIRFLILGVWRKKNRLQQYNGDLIDRVSEIPVEPWNPKDFHAIIHKGQDALHLEIHDEVVERIIKNSCGSVGVLQELLRTTCKNSGLDETSENKHIIGLKDGSECLDTAIAEKTDDYANRHERALISIATFDLNHPLFNELYIQYLFVAAVIDQRLPQDQVSFKKSALLKIINNLSGGEKVTAPDLDAFFNSLQEIQWELDISPSIFDYDRSSQCLNIIDSTFLFFLRNTDVAQLLGEITSPFD
jgi:hypothetical protein